MLLLSTNGFHSCQATARTGDTPHHPPNFYNRNTFHKDTYLARIHLRAYPLPVPDLLTLSAPASSMLRLQPRNQFAKHVLNTLQVIQVIHAPTAGLNIPLYVLLAPTSRGGLVSTPRRHTEKPSTWTVADHRSTFNLLILTHVVFWLRARDNNGFPRYLLLRPAFLRRYHLHHAEPVIQFSLSLRTRWRRGQAAIILFPSLGAYRTFTLRIPHNESIQATIRLRLPVTT
ncbi:hypothetical protein BBAD15_g12536 [Beauveria bassiana D1-5]|uniref:Uncharacterized protein n=1 Tax=Beauveria bassiana D1-5 TaxID=1245745 RepID=A0A0A2V838_BEABA|nr:hypothetical protein BBAD15_g12536 [Beauveria bassiana D1-5]